MRNYDTPDGKKFPSVTTIIGDCTDKSGALSFALKALADDQTSDSVQKFSFSTKGGKMSMALQGLDLTGISDPEAHLTFEVTIHRVPLSIEAPEDVVVECGSDLEEHVTGEVAISLGANLSDRADVVEPGGGCPGTETITRETINFD